MSLRELSCEFFLCHLNQNKKIIFEIVFFFKIPSGVEGTSQAQTERKMLRHVGKKMRCDSVCLSVCMSACRNIIKNSTDFDDIWCVG